MNKKTLITVIIVLLLAGTVAAVVFMTGKTAQQEETLYELNTKQKNQDLIITIAKGAHKSYVWKAVPEEGALCEVTDQSTRAAGRFLVHADPLHQFLISFYLEKEDGSDRILSKTVYLKTDEQGILTMTGSTENQLAGSVSGGEDGLLPYTVSGQADGSLLLVFPSDEETNRKWETESSDGLDLIGPVSYSDHTEYLIRGLESGIFDVVVSSRAAALKLTLKISSEYNGEQEGAEGMSTFLKVISHEMTPYEPVSDTAAFDETRASFVTEYGMIYLPEEFEVLEYKVGTYYGRDESEPDFPCGAIDFSKTVQSREELYQLHLSDEASLNAFTDRIEEAGCEKTEISVSGICFRIYQSGEYMSAAWEYEERIYLLEQDHCAAPDADAFAGLAARITLGK